MDQSRFVWDRHLGLTIPWVNSPHIGLLFFMKRTNRSCFIPTSIVFLCISIQGLNSDDRFSDRFVRWISPSARTMDAEIDDLLKQSEGLPEPVLFNRSESLGYHSRRYNTPDEVNWVEIDLLKEQEIDQIAVLPVFVEIPSFEGKSYGFPVRFRIDVFGEDRSQVSVVADHSSEDYLHTEGYPYSVSLQESVRGRYIRMTSLVHSSVYDHWVFSISEIMVLKGPINLAAGCPVEERGWVFQIAGWNPANLTDSQSPLGPPVVPEPSPTNGLSCEHADSPYVYKWMQVDLGSKYPIDAIRLLPARPTDYIDLPGLGFPVRFKIELSNDPDFQSKQLLFDSGPEVYPNPGDNPFEIHADEKEARFVRVIANEVRYQGSKYSFSLGELQVYSNGKNVARNKVVSASDVFNNPDFPLWNLDGLVDGYNSQNRLVELPDWLAGLEERRKLSSRLVQLKQDRSRKAEMMMVSAVMVTLAISGFLVVVGISFFISYRRKKGKEAEEVRRQISRDLHDDIGGDLGGIYILSEGVLQQTGLSNEVREDLEDIHNIAKGSGEALQDIVWLIREERNLEELLLHLRATVQLQLRKIPYSWEVLSEKIPSRPVPLKVRRHVFFAFKEVLTNVRKHAEAQQVEITIKLSCTQPLLNLRISDDGKGFDQNTKAMGYGLSNVRGRCDALNGSCEIVSKPGNGTRIDLSFSLKA